jgi:hypothetical protein
MPNHVTTVCEVTGPCTDVAQFVAMHITEREWRGERRESFDFESIIPMPQCVKNTIRPTFDQPIPDGVPKDSVGDYQVEICARAIMTYPGAFILPGEVYAHSMPPKEHATWGDLREHFAKTYPAAEFWARRLLLCAGETGSPGWCEWSCANWGTKWPAYECSQRSSEPARFVFEFQTAWSMPEPIFEAIATRYPSLQFKLTSIDEGGPEYEAIYSAVISIFEEVEPSDERYLLVYGRARPIYDADGEEGAAAPETVSAIREAP